MLYHQVLPGVKLPTITFVLFMGWTVKPHPITTQARRCLSDRMVETASLFLSPCAFMANWLKEESLDGDTVVTRAMHRKATVSSSLSSRLKTVTASERNLMSAKHVN